MNVINVLCRVVTLKVLLVAAPVWAEAPRLQSIEDFFRRPLIESPRLSPDGKRIGMIVTTNEGRTVLAVADIATPQKRIGIARFGDGDVRSFRWVNDQRLVFDAIDFQAPLGEQFGAGLYAIDVDGGNFEFLVGRGCGFESQGHVAIRPLRWNHVFHRAVRDGSDDVLVLLHNLRYAHEPESTTPLRLNTRTRATRELVTDTPDHATGWVLDQTGVPRSAISTDLKGNARVMRRKSGTADWVEMDSYDIFDPKPGSFEPMAFDVDGSLIVAGIAQ